MGIFNNVFLGLCILHILINFSPGVAASRRPWTSADKSGAERRRTRAVNRPNPIDCRMESWSSWTPCNACTDKKFRFRYMVKPSQFGGTDCLETLWNKLACPASTSQCLVPDYCGESFTCKVTGRCISQSLRCNGESDCEDSSDEDGCEKFNLRNDKCSTFQLIPGAGSGTQGYNVLTRELMDHVLDPKYFGGQCEYVYNGEWRKFTYDAFCENLHYNEDEKNYRKPYNYHTYHFVAQATSEGSHEYFDDVVSLLNARKTMSSFNLGFTIGIAQVEGGLSGSHESEFLKNITKNNSENKGFVRLFSKVQTAHFKMRTNKLMLHEDFYIALMELPEQYDFGMYSRLFNTFGTHYITEGTMGGTLEYVVVINKTSTAHSHHEGEEAGRCLGASIGLNNPISETSSVDLKLKKNFCKKGGRYEKVEDSDSVFVEDIHTLVKGGLTHSSSGVKVIRNPDTYRKWGATLKYNPTLVNFEIMPIYELLRFSTAADHVGLRLDNLKRGLDEYLQQFDPCRCAPCKHNGIPFLKVSSCGCICKSGYHGDACEDTLRRDTKTDGQWSCWGSWATCTSGKKTRTRSCNNPAPEGGGATCLGSTSQSQRC